MCYHAEDETIHEDEHVSYNGLSVNVRNEGTKEDEECTNVIDETVYFTVSTAQLRDDIEFGKIAITPGNHWRFHRL